jgi:16S rRNA (cytidine1402-2'-O)-methyltransferase
MAAVTPGTLYVVGLPIGHPDDITARALKVLGGVSAVLSEDTRRTRTLFNHYELQTALERFDAHVEGQRLDAILTRLQQGEALAIVSDAGTPGISDPGHRLVRAARDAGLAVVPIPGASAVTTALSASGAGASGFVFHGFLPKAVEARIETLAALAPGTHVFFSPARDLPEIARDAATVSTIDRLTIARELTKLHESFYFGPPSDLVDRLAHDPEASLGEAVVIAEVVARETDDDAITTALRAAIADGQSPRDAARIVAARLGASRRHVYQLALSLGVRP